MPTKKKATKADKRDFVERAIDGMTKRLERGTEPFSEPETRLFVALLQAQNNRNLLSDHDLLEEWGERFQKIENWINTRQTIQSATRRQRTPPGIQQQAGPFDGNT